MPNRLFRQNKKRPHREGVFLIRSLVVLTMRDGGELCLDVVVGPYELLAEDVVATDLPAVEPVPLHAVREAWYQIEHQNDLPKNS
ncbi:MAG: hypothetical protein HOE50_08805 [Chloroflexi bacterium]|nr:hypothetical protein [Chloroflexota bacterium]MBT6706647.1 hypothetical protein [Chloroflexota bacterium]MBT7004371.1 hypothetical protein [Chloroflexota bacterium]